MRFAFPPGRPPMPGPCAATCTVSAFPARSNEFPVARRGDWASQDAGIAGCLRESMNDGRAYDEQGLPWLEAVDDEDGPRPVAAGKMLAAIVIVALSVAVIAGAFFWL